ncbi:hypothetical protein SAY86_029347 [Trapa natans]|uniref:Pectinesterase inhibitor domain-containing protein n=1 Tax=Trapa natans TaxID=22666 RepID=A0AAN7M127_TRANT|nr:hypothetical protein SAY86_029347 [Trapa natans]
MRIPPPLLFPLSLLLLLLLLLPTSHSSSSSNGEDLIDQTCKLTPFYDLCQSSLRSSPSSSSSDLRGLAQIMAGSVLDGANRTLGQIQQLLDRSSPADPAADQPLAYCAELYIPVVKYSLPQAIDALSKGRLGFAVYGITDAMNEAGDCNKKISSGDGSSSPVSDGNMLVMDLAAVALSIIKVLQKSL